MKKEVKVVAIGEVLWDVFPDKKCLGGAPLNFVYHCKNFGIDANIISAVGEDDLGEEILVRVKELDVSAEYIQHSIFSTGTVQIELDQDGQPKYRIVEDVAWDNIVFNEELKKLAERTDIFYFGSLACRSEVTKGTILRYIESLPVSAKKIFDINIRQEYYSKELISKLLLVADIFKVNDEEIDLLKGFFGDKQESEREFLLRLQSDFDLDLIVLTRGEKGSLLLSGEEANEFVSEKVSVKDTVGAGDSFTAAVCYGLINDLSLKEINKLANKLASFVCTKSGATPKVEDIWKIIKE